MQSLKDEVLSVDDEHIPATMSIESSTLDAIICTQTHIRFQIPNRGILSRDTSLQLEFLTTTEGDNKAFFPLNAGVFSAVLNAKLSCGTSIISSCDNVAFLQSIHKAYNSASYRSTFDRTIHGINNVFGVSPLPEFSDQMGTFSLKNTKTVSPRRQDCPYDLLLRSTSEENGVYTIFLRQLFPILEASGIEIPLFMLNAPLVVDITLKQQTNTSGGGDVPSKGVGTICNFLGDNVSPYGPYTGDTSVRLNTNSVFLFLDTIYYNDRRMDQIAGKLAPGLALEYTDIVSTVASIPSVKTAITNSEVVEQKVNNLIAVSSMKCKNIHYCFTTLDRTSHGQTPPHTRYYNPYLGRYEMHSTPRDDAFNIRVNDQLVFNAPIQTAAQKASECSFIYDSPICLNSAFYSQNPSSHKSGNFGTKTELFPDNSASGLVSYDGLNLRDLNGKSYFGGYNLSSTLGDNNEDSTLVTRPLEFQHTIYRSETQNQDLTALYFVETTKRFTINNGAVEIFT